MLYKVIGTTRSPPRELARAWKEIYSLLDNADIKIGLPEILMDAFKDLGDKYVELEATADGFAGDGDVTIVVIVLVVVEVVVAFIVIVVLVLVVVAVVAVVLVALAILTLAVYC